MHNTLKGKINLRLGHSSLATTGQSLADVLQAENGHAAQIAEMFGLEDE